MLLVFIVWKIGPMVAESYQYSLVKGRIEAEFDTAEKMLATDPLQSVSEAYQLVAMKTRPSVVSVRAESEVPGEASGQGSGVIMSEEGYILTNEHVVGDSNQINVTLYDRRIYRAKVIGATDRYNDLAVLKIEADNLIPAEWGDSDKIEVGSIVWAIGSPFGLAQSVTSGIVSAKNRYDVNSPKQELLQTDAAVNPGNSGGPLVDSLGRVVGINTSIHGSEFRGISFAVPSVQAKFVYEQIIEKGYVSRGLLGATPRPVFQRDANRLGLPDIDGALLERVAENSPAKQSGLRANDVVRTWNGKTIDEFLKLYRFVSMTEPQSVAEVGIIRNGKEQILNVKVGSRRSWFGVSDIR